MSQIGLVAPEIATATFRAAVGNDQKLPSGCFSDFF